jgi:3'-5' exoribonuclease
MVTGMGEPALLTISQIRGECLAGPVACRVRGQAEQVTKKDSANGKPYWELRLRDASDVLTLRAWTDTVAFDSCAVLGPGACVEVEGEFLINGSFGLDGRRWRLRTLSDSEADALFADVGDGSAERDFACVRALVEGISDPRLRGLGQIFLDEHGARFRRAAAARANHHAHRGGLLRHTARMMRAADALCGVYGELNRDLLLAGVLFHDSGKLWEMCPPARGFDILRGLRGELLGHISIGIELVNTLWRKLPCDEWRALRPASEDVRLHLLHLVAAHHGELQYGSPVDPKTPEAIALHFVDNMDAKLEMFAMAYARQPEIAPGIRERVRTLNTSPVNPLARVPETDGTAHGESEAADAAAPAAGEVG